MMHEVCLPTFLRPRLANTLVRLGSVNDGGYVVDSRSVNKSETLLSFGLSDNWDFEESFLLKKKSRLLAFDKSIGYGSLAKNGLKSLLNTGNIFLFCRKLKKIIDYYKFFSNNNNVHVKKFVGLNNHPSYLDINQIFEIYSLGAKKEIFLKLDIEGWEYRILEQISDRACCFTGAVIEFHDVDLHLSTIKNFIQNFPLNICHVHCNNYSHYNNKDIPLCIEVSFTSYDLANAYSLNLPSQIDNPNDPEHQDYIIKFT